ncbi:unnamed protein product [Sphenostylis stenocarpa]|uniref:Uncharacterized protein n=1 Tax=Sphenostylis stenocarpa TaxID=92480 RepID=A0AA86T696_9FABA|nr:unnamed protein product [Sphenostylis stenocarpa]
MRVAVSLQVSTVLPGEGGKVVTRGVGGSRHHLLQLAFFKEVVLILKLTIQVPNAVCGVHHTLATLSGYMQFDNIISLFSQIDQSTSYYNKTSRSIYKS